MARPKLTDVPGIAKATAGRLARRGIRTVAALVETSPATIAALPGFGPARAKNIQAAAAALLGDTVPRTTSPRTKPVSPTGTAAVAKKKGARSAGSVKEKKAKKKKSKKKKGALSLETDTAGGKKKKKKKKAKDKKARKKDRTERKKDRLAKKKGNGKKSGKKKGKKK